MDTPIKQRNPNNLTQAQVTEYVFAAKVTYTDDHSITALEVNKKLSLGPLTAAAKTFTLPQITALNDGAIYGILNDSYYQLTLACNAADHVWNSGDGYGLDMYGKGCMVWVQADYNSGTRPVWDVIMRTGGGRVMVEGLVLHEKMDILTTYDAAGSAYASGFDLTKRHKGDVYGDTYVTGNSKFPPSCYQFDGTGDYMSYIDSPDWDIFGTQTGVKVAAGWVYASGLDDVIITQREDDANRWMLEITGAGLLQFRYLSSLSASVVIDSDATVVTADSWRHVAFILDTVGNIGVYIMGVQVGYASSAGWTADTFAGSLYFGQKGDGNNYFSGRMQDWHIAYNDTLGLSAAPDSGLTSTYTVPAAPMNLVM